MKYKDAMLGDLLPVFTEAGNRVSGPEGTTQLLGSKYPELQGQNLRIVASSGQGNEVMVEVPTWYFDSSKKILEVGVPVDQLRDRPVVRLVVKGSDCTQGETKPEPAFHPHEENVVSDAAQGARTRAWEHITTTLEGYSPYTKKMALEYAIQMLQTRLNTMIGREYDQPEDEDQDEEIYHRDDE